MEIETPKVQHNPNDNPNKGMEFAILLHDVFEKSKSGKMLLERLKDRYVSNKYEAGVFPAHPSTLSQFGNSIEAYCGFKAGQANLIFQIEQILEQYDEIVKQSDQVNQTNKE